MTPEDFDVWYKRGMDSREYHIKALVLLMLNGELSAEVKEYLEVREYGLALQALTWEVMNRK